MKKYTCNDYRQEMMLAGLRKRLAEEAMSEKDRAQLEAQIHQLEREMGID